MTSIDGDSSDSPALSEAISIVDVSDVLGVPMPTLRSWELRYGIPDMLRESGKHRRYSSQDLHALRLMRDEIARGHQAGAAAASVRALLGLGGPGAEYLHGFLDATHHCDSTAIRAQLTRATDALGLGSCLDDVVMPGMRQVGRWWETGSCSVRQERIATDSVRNWLGHTSAFSPADTGKQPILLACGPMELHTVGIEGLATLLRSRGHRCTVLGSCASPAALVAATRAAEVAAVVLVSHLATGRRRTMESLSAVSAMKIPVYYAGNSFTAPRARAGVSGTYLGLRLQEATTRIIADLETWPTNRPNKARIDPVAS